MSRATLVLLISCNQVLPSANPLCSLLTVSIGWYERVGVARRGRPLPLQPHECLQIHAASSSGRCRSASSGLCVRPSMPRLRIRLSTRWRSFPVLRIRCAPLSSLRSRQAHRWRPTGCALSSQRIRDCASCVLIIFTSPFLIPRAAGRSSHEPGCPVQQ